MVDGRDHLDLWTENWGIGKERESSGLDISMSSLLGSLSSDSQTSCFPQRQNSRLTRIAIIDVKQLASDAST